METPCNKICTLDPQTRLCLGCGRSLDEIAGWHRMDDAQRRGVMLQLPARMQARDPARLRQG